MPCLTCLQYIYVPALYLLTYLSSHLPVSLQRESDPSGRTCLGPSVRCSRVLPAPPARPAAPGSGGRKPGGSQPRPGPGPQPRARAVRGRRRRRLLPHRARSRRRPASTAPGEAAGPERLRRLPAPPPRAPSPRGEPGWERALPGRGGEGGERGVMCACACVCIHACARARVYTCVCARARCVCASVSVRVCARACVCDLCAYVYTCV